MRKSNQRKRSSYGKIGGSIKISLLWRAFLLCKKGVLRREANKLQLMQKVCPYKAEGEAGSSGIHLQRLQKMRKSQGDG